MVVATERFRRDRNGAIAEVTARWRMPCNTAFKLPQLFSVRKMKSYLVRGPRRINYE
jgi:hypothetical protein